MNSNPLDFHTAPYELFFEKEPNYSGLEKDIEVLNILTSMNNSNICVLDFYRHNYFYISPNHFFMCGYNLEDIKTKGEAIVEKIIYKEDLENQYEMKQAVCKFFESLDIETLKQTSLFSTHRFIHKNGNVFWASNHYKPFLFDDNNKVWMLLCVSNLSTKTHSLESYIEIANTKECFIFSQKKKTFLLSDKPKFTTRELEILILAAQGYTSKEIALKKNISIPTVKFHKQNIMSKLNVNNISEAILYAYSHNLF